MNKVIVGLSGGVDSAVSALLLKKQGFDVIAVHMQNWEYENYDQYCSLVEDLKDAQLVAQKIKVPLEVVNFSDEYWNFVFKNCINQFSYGLTPNPDILCNKEIKFKALLKYASKKGIRYLATGHYSNIDYLNGEYKLKKGKDLSKDQSYFLYMVNKLSFSRLLFPLSNLEKREIRKIAMRYNLHNYNKKDSMGICFVGTRKFREFLKCFMLSKPGDIVSLEKKVIGNHSGLMFYTIGQREGIGIGGIKSAKSDPWYVLEKDIKNNNLVVCQRKNHSSLFSYATYGVGFYWHSNKTLRLPFLCESKVRYGQKQQHCSIIYVERSKFIVEFLKPERALSSGQSIVFYSNDICLGGGVIKKPISSPISYRRERDSNPR